MVPSHRSRNSSLHPVGRLERNLLGLGEDVERSAEETEPRRAAENANRRDGENQEQRRRQNQRQRVSERIRAFVALRLPSALREAVADIQAAVRRNVSGARWVHPDNFHLTVRFLGDLDGPEVERAAEVVKNTRFHSIVVRLGIVSAFPSVSRPQVLWVGLDSEEDRLQRFVTGFEIRLGEAGFGPADKPWKSHLTLGRISGRGQNPRGWTRGISPPTDPYRLDSLSLFRSELLPGGARHTPLVTARGTD